MERKIWKLLIVEDDILVREMLAQRFERDGFEVHWAEDGLEGLRKVGHLKPDLIITDIVMPQMSGTEMIAAIKESHPKIKIVAISGGGRMGIDLPVLNSTETSEILRLLDSSEEKGALLSLQKPVDLNDLSLAITLLLTDPERRRALLEE